MMVNVMTFENVKKRFGFGLMRLPMLSKEEVDIEQVKKMVDYFIQNGFNYFDTAHGYIGGLSELAFKEAVSKRYARCDYILTNKLSGSFFKTNEDIRPLIKKQLEACGVEYFDYYLMHAQDKNSFEHFKKCQAFEEALKLKEEGLIKHIGFSFHDTVDVLEEILDTYPFVEVVQIQMNYLDMESSIIQSKKLYDLLTKRNIPIIVMEPVKGGTLARISDKALKEFQKLGNSTPASYALRYVLNYPNVKMVLSGMSNFEQMVDNVNTTKCFIPLTNKELKTIEKVKEIIIEEKLIPCTACEYCVAGCPKKIMIPELFKIMNRGLLNEWYHLWSDFNELTANSGKPSECIKCGKCENICPQHLPIRELLEKMKESFEK